MKNLSIKKKLIFLVVLGLVFVCAVVVIETISNASIEKANDENFALMEQANQQYRQKTEAAQQQLDQIQAVLNNVQYARIAEKSYLQFYKSEYASQLGEYIQQALATLDKVDENEFTQTLMATLETYRQDFGRIVTLHQFAKRLHGHHENQQPFDTDAVAQPATGEICRDAEKGHGQKDTIGLLATQSHLGAKRGHMKRERRDDQRPCGQS